MDHLPSINCVTIPHHTQRYDTAGNYGESQLGWWLEISKMKDWRYEMLVLIHELTEMALTKQANVEWKQIDLFDTTVGKDHPDPGTMPEAPYFEQHAQATKIERMLAKMLGVNWKKYDKSFEELKWRP